MRLAPATAGWLRSRIRHVFLSLPISAREETRSQPHSAALPPHSLPLSPVLTRCSEHAAQSRAPALRLASSVYVGGATAPPTGLNPHWIRDSGGAVPVGRLAHFLNRDGGPVAGKCSRHRQWHCGCHTVAARLASDAHTHTRASFEVWKGKGLCVCACMSAHAPLAHRWPRPARGPTRERESERDCPEAAGRVVATANPPSPTPRYSNPPSPTPRYPNPPSPTGRVIATDALAGRGFIGSFGDASVIAQPQQASPLRLLGASLLL